MGRTLALVLATVVAGAVAPVSGSLAAPSPPVTLVASTPDFPEHERVVRLDAYAQPITAVGYDDGVGTAVTVTLANPPDGSPVTVHDVDPFPGLLGMLEGRVAYGLPIEVGPGDEVEVFVRARFANCAYYTERAVDRYLGAEVDVSVAGTRRTVTLLYPSEVVLRSPTILGCGDRVTDRSARQRMLARDE